MVRVPRPLNLFRLPLAVAAVAVVVSAGPSPESSAGAMTAGSVLKSARSAIDAEPSAHVQFVGHVSSTTERLVADLGTTSGVETITEARGRLLIRVTPTAAYMSGNEDGLTTLFGLTGTQAKSVGTRWVSWKPGTTGYDNLKEAVTMASVVSLLPKAAGTRLSTSGTGGASHYVLKWTTAKTSTIPKLSNTLTVPASGTYLPLGATATASGGVKLVTTLSRWGEAVVVPVPPPARTVSSSKIKS